MLFTRSYKYNFLDQCLNRLYSHLQEIRCGMSTNILQTELLHRKKKKHKEGKTTKCLLRCIFHLLRALSKLKAPQCVLHRKRCITNQLLSLALLFESQSTELNDNSQSMCILYPSICMKLYTSVWRHVSMHSKDSCSLHYLSTFQHGTRKINQYL